VDQDPFEAFFQAAGVDSEGIFQLKIENGKIAAGELNRWLVWLESEKPQIKEGEILARIAPFLVERIAGQYLSLIRPK